MSFVLLGILNSQAAGAAGAGAYDLLETQTLASSAASVTFTGLDSYTDYKHLQIRGVARTDRASSGGDVMKITFNSITSSDYAWHYLRSGVTSNAGTSQTGINANQSNSAGDTSNTFGAFVTDILDFASSSKNTTLKSLSGTSSVIELSSGLLNNTASITSINLDVLIGTNFVSGSRFSLYGVK